FPREAVGREAAQRAQREDCNLRAEPRGPQQEFRMRETVNQPPLRRVLHPGADEGNDLPANEEPEIAMPQCAEGMWHARRRSTRTERFFTHVCLCGPHLSSSIMRGTIKDQSQTSSGELLLADEKLFKAEYLGSGTFVISKPKRKKTKVRQSALKNPRRG